MGGSLNVLSFCMALFHFAWRPLSFCMTIYSFKVSTKKPNGAKKYSRLSLKKRVLVSWGHLMWFPQHRVKISEAQFLCVHRPTWRSIGNKMLFKISSVSHWQRRYYKLICQFYRLILSDSSEYFVKLSIDFWLDFFI